MIDNVIELRPGIRKPEPYIRPMDLSDPRQETDVIRECRLYAISVFARLTGEVSANDLHAAINITSSISTILQSLAAARIARNATETAIALDYACREALEQAERI